jgi:hypothetical protein
VSTTEELLGTKSSGSGLENRDYGRRVPSRCPRGTLCPPTSGGRSDDIVCSRTQATEFSLVFLVVHLKQEVSILFVWLRSLRNFISIVELFTADSVHTVILQSR